jgi:hypothetical protein
VSFYEAINLDELVKHHERFSRGIGRQTESAPPPRFRRHVMSLTKEIRNYALDLGYSRVGITTAEPFPLFARALKERLEDYDWAVDSALRLGLGAEPQNRLPGASSIIVAVYDYVRERFPENLAGKIGRLYQSRSYIEPPTRLGGARVQLMRRFLEAKGMQVGRWFAISSGVPDRLAAVRAGVGTIGRNTFLRRARHRDLRHPPHLHRGCRTGIRCPGGRNPLPA